MMARALLPHETPIPGIAADFAGTLGSMLPRIETDRLVLRAPVLEDFPAYLEIAQGPNGQFILDGGTREDAWLDFAQMVATWLLRGHGLFTVMQRATEDVLGFVVLGFEPGDHEPELGYMFRTHAEGMGYAHEAAVAARAHGMHALGLTTLVSTIDPDNSASIKLATRLGAQRDLAAEAAHSDAILVYRHPGPEDL